MNIEEFRRVGEWFKRLPQTARVNMAQTWSDADLLHDCKSPACFGGWLSVFYGHTKIDGYRHWECGAREFEETLGFDLE